MGKQGESMIEEMKKDLGLSAAQAGQLKAELKADRAVCKPLEAKMTLDVDRLKVLVDKKAADGDLKPVIAEVVADHQALQAQMSAHWGAMQAILTPTQQAKEALHLHARMQHGMKAMHGEKDDKDEKDGKGEHDDK
jgi:Spy/CpxP family protein refolding chaperone